MSDNLINSLKRLERAGAENSRATKKLHEAAAEVADRIERLVPSGVRLPRGYIVDGVKSNVGYARFLKREDDEWDEWGEPTYTWIDGTGSYLHGDFHCWIPAQTRAGSLQFAKDVAEGLLDEIAAFLEEWAAKNDEATAILESHAK